MMTQSEKHDQSTFQNVLADYLDTYGIEMPLSIQEVIVRKFFKPDDTFKPVCAIQYGDLILCVPQKGLSELRGFIFWDSRRKAIRKIFLNECAREKEKEEVL